MDLAEEGKLVKCLSYRAFLSPNPKEIMKEEDEGLKLVMQVLEGKRVVTCKTGKSETHPTAIEL